MRNPITKLVGHFAAASLAIAAGCTGTVVETGITGPGGPTGPTGPTGNRVPIECGGPATPAVGPLSRFQVSEYERSLRLLLGSNAVDGVSDRIAALPTDAPVSEDEFARQDHRLTDRHVESYYNIANELSVQVRQNVDLRVDLAGECARSGADPACLRSFAERFLDAAYRRPPENEAVDSVVTAASAFAGEEQWQAVVFLTLMAPEFLYRFETRGIASGGVLTLDPFDLASRLSFHFWGEAPDDELLRAAADGELSTDAGYAAQLDRMTEDPRTEETIMEFFRGWLHLEGGDFIASARLSATAGGIDTVGLAEEMRTEVVDLLRFHLESDESGWTDVFTSPLSFARSERLAGIYGVPAWDGTGTPPSLPAGERSGLLTRAGMLYTGDGSTNPFRRGIFIRRILLCDDIPPPPATLPADALRPPDTVENVSTRGSFENKVVGEPCASCHASFSPLGYALEAYDGLGRFRTEEQLFAPDGSSLGTVPVDSSAVPAIEGGDDTIVSSAVEMSERIAESSKANTCFARRYFRFTYRREETSADECTVGSIAQQLEDGASLRSALRSVALEPAFRQRRLEE